MIINQAAFLLCELNATLKLQFGVYFKSSTEVRAKGVTSKEGWRILITLTLPEHRCIAYLYESGTRASEGQ